MIYSYWSVPDSYQLVHSHNQHTTFYLWWGICHPTTLFFYTLIGLRPVRKPGAKPCWTELERCVNRRNIILYLCGREHESRFSEHLLNLFWIKPNHMLWTQSIIWTIFNVLFRLYWQLSFIIRRYLNFLFFWDCIDVLGGIFLTWLAPAYDRTESARQDILWLLW